MDHRKGIKTAAYVSGGAVLLIAGLVAPILAGQAWGGWGALGVWLAECALYGYILGATE